MAEGVKEAAKRDHGEKKGGEQSLLIPTGSRPWPWRARPDGQLDASVPPPLHLSPSPSRRPLVPASPTLEPPLLPQRRGPGRCRAGTLRGAGGGSTNPARSAGTTAIFCRNRLGWCRLPSVVGAPSPSASRRGKTGETRAHTHTARTCRPGTGTARRCSPASLPPSSSTRHNRGPRRQMIPPPRHLCKVQPAAQSHTPFSSPTAQILPPHPPSLPHFHRLIRAARPPGPAARPLPR